MATYSFNLTKESIDKIAYPKSKRDIYVDTKENGLILIVSYGKSKVFYLRKTVDGTNRKIKLGDFPDDISLGEARDKAAELKSQINKGIHPFNKSSNELPTLDSQQNQQPTKLAELTFKELFFDKYIEEYCKPKKTDWKAAIDTMDRDGEHFYDKKISAITREDIQKTFNVITNRGKYSANRFFELLRSVFNKAIAWGLLEKNPALGIEENQEEARERYISTKEEMSRFIETIKASTNRQMADVFLLSLLTGARKSNVLSIKWRNVNFEDRTWYIPAVQTKKRKAQVIHLVEDAITMLARRKEENKAGSIWVFPSARSRCGHLTSPKRAWKKICQVANIDELRIHDLRRTHGCLMRKAGADREVIGEALGHKDLKSTKIYDIIEGDQVRAFREKAMKNLMFSKEDTVTFQIETANNNTESLEVLYKKKIEELEQQIRELKHMQGYNKVFMVSN